MCCTATCISDTTIEQMCARNLEEKTFWYVQIDPGYLSSPETIEFPTEGGLTAFMNYYGPKSKDFKLPPSELPPLLIKVVFSLGPASSREQGQSIQDTCNKNYSEHLKRLLSPVIRCVSHLLGIYFRCPYIV